MDFKTFILKQLKRAGIEDSMGEKMFDESKNLFIQAFTDSSVSTENNQTLVTFGDSIVNLCIYNNIRKLYPELERKPMMYTFLKAKSEENLFLHAEKEGFFEHIRISDKLKEIAINWRDNIGKDDFIPSTNENTYIKQSKNTLKSFCAALCISMNNLGSGVESVDKWISFVVENLTFDPTNLSVTQNIKQKLKELWDHVYEKEIDKTGIKISNNRMFKVVSKKPGHVVMSACDPNPTKNSRDAIVVAVGYNEDNARYNAASAAYPIVKEKYTK